MLEFRREDNPEIESCTCELVEDDKVIDSVHVIDYTCQFHQDFDRRNRFERPYSFRVTACGCSEGFDYDEDYDKHYGENDRPIGGYQGTCTHTVEDIKKWSENWLAQGWLHSYYDTLKRLDTLKSRAEWFESQGFVLEERED